MSSYISGRAAAAAFLLCGPMALAIHSQSFTTLASFDGSNGVGPLSLLQGHDGKLYGLTGAGSCTSEPTGCGTVFKITTEGTLANVFKFDGTNGQYPISLVQAPEGDFYGLTNGGGANSCARLDSAGCGTFFRMTPGGKLTTLYNFCSQPNCTDGYQPDFGLVQATGGAFFGTTDSGGAYTTGTAFQITQRGELTTLFSFCTPDNCLYGSDPNTGVIQAPDGLFYGTTNVGGSACAFEGSGGCGTVFKMTPAGALTSILSFNGPDGYEPGPLIQAPTGDLYGTTTYGGPYNCPPFTTGCGTIFKIAPGGEFTTLYTFNGTDGAWPDRGLVLGSDGAFYGTTNEGGANDTTCEAPYRCGTIFRFSIEHGLKTLHSFNGTDGSNPTAIVQDTNGDFYGGTWQGGADNDGTLFRLSTGLAPFVRTVPAFGKAGASVIILGTNLTGATGVAFNGSPAAFTVVSATLITTTVPAAATPGKVEVATPGGVLVSAPFIVTP